MESEESEGENDLAVNLKIAPEWFGNKSDTSNSIGRIVENEMGGKSENSIHKSDLFRFNHIYLFALVSHFLQVET